MFGARRVSLCVVPSDPNVVAGSVDSARDAKADGSHGGRRIMPVGVSG